MRTASRVLGSAPYMRARCFWTMGGIAFLAIFSPNRALADDRATQADRLFERARTLMAAGRYVEACPLLEQSEALDPGIGTELNLARCYDLVGRPASASAMYQRVIEETRAAGQEEREGAARKLQAELAARVAHATIRPSQGASTIAGLEIRCDGAPLERASWGKPSPLDPGTHLVEATAPGMDAWKTSFVIRQDGQSVDVEVPALTPHREEGAIESSSAFAPTQRKIAVVAFGAGVVAAGVGTYFGLRTIAKRDEANGTSGAQYAELQSEKETAGNIATGMFIGAGALLATSVILWITTPKASPARTVLLAPALTPSSGSLLLTAHWQ